MLETHHSPFLILKPWFNWIMLQLWWWWWLHLAQTLDINMENMMPHLTMVLTKAIQEQLQQIRLLLRNKSSLYQTIFTLQRILSSWSRCFQLWNTFQSLNHILTWKTETAAASNIQHREMNRLCYSWKLEGVQMLSIIFCTW